MSIHEHVLEELKTDVLSDLALEKKYGELLSLSEDSGNDYPILKSIFHNIRVGKNGEYEGLSLTPRGYLYLSKKYDSYEVMLSSKERGLTNAQLLKLDSHMSWPYHVSRKTQRNTLGKNVLVGTVLYVFTAEDAAWLKMAAGDLDTFLGMI